MAEKEETQTEEKKSFMQKLKDYIKNLFDFSKYDTKTILFIILFIVLVIVSLFLLYLVFVDETFLYRIVVEWFVNPIILLGIWGIFLFIGVMAIQGLLVPIPSEVVLLATGMIWGVWIGGIMGIIGSMAAGLLCFYISRKGGRPLAEKFIGENVIEVFDNFIQKHGMVSILILRSTPVLAFDPVSYVSGLVELDAKKYAIGTLIGSIPRAFFYSILGALLTSVTPGQIINLADIPLVQIEEYARFFNIITIIILAVLVLAFVVSLLLARKKVEKQK
jgi:uncharacterized membrane protein YdjX (TVP38/TMEM64 family)